MSQTNPDLTNDVLDDAEASGLLLLKDNASEVSGGNTVTFTGISPVDYTATQNGETINANSGVDKISDGGYAVTINAGAGTDIFTVHNAATVVSDNFGSNYDTIQTDLASYTLPAHVQALTYTGSHDFHGIGNDAKNVIMGGAGNDTLDGGAGADRLVGGPGNDTYYFDTPGDYAVEQPKGGFDSIYTSVGTKASPNVEQLIYTGTVGVSLYAAESGTGVSSGPGNDKIFGGSGDDTLDGDPKDFVNPNTGNVGGFGETDTLYGGAGADTFILHPTGYAVERILDFAPGTDHLKTVDPNVPPQDYEFTTQAPQPVDDDGGHDIVSILYYDKPAGQLYYVDFLSGGVDEHLIATFDNHPTLSASDFIFT